MKNNNLNKLFTLLILIVLLYTLINSIILFYGGYHNLDTAQNFIKLGYEADINLDGEIVNLGEYYLIGLNSMINGFGWVCFDVILSLIFGYSFKGVGKR